MRAMPAAIYLMMLGDAMLPEVRHERPSAAPGEKGMGDRQKHQQQSALRALQRIQCLQEVSAK